MTRCVRVLGSVKLGCRQHRARAVKRSHKTPVRSALVDGCKLHDRTQDGLQALKGDHRSQLLQEEVRTAFADSLDLDEALRESFPEENRWDYLLGHSGSNSVVGLEPHSAHSDQISTVIAKRAAAIRQLRPFLRRSDAVVAWYWVASGRVDFVPMEKAVFRLQQAGITFVGRKLSKRHLPAAAAQSRRG
jgi:hypothetical protein